MWNAKTIDLDKALYIAIADALERDIRNGTLKPGQKLPTHRDLADIIGVNVSTATRAYKEAERRGLISGTVGRGTYIAADVEATSSLVKVDQKTHKMIEMGLVLPLYNVEPDISEIIEKLLKYKQLNRFLRYTDPLGLPEHRETGAYWTKRFGISATADDIVICAGAQHALTCCLNSLFKPGDRIAVDSLTYPGMKSISKDLGIRLEPVLMDEEGMIPENLETVCHRNSISGIYLMPSMQNPTTASMSLKRREEIAEIVQRSNLILIEDDVYSFANQSHPQAIASLIPENSIYIAGISKAFYAGLRVAFVAAPEQFRYKIAKAVLNTIWMAPPLNAAIVSECIKDGTADRIISLKLKEISKRVMVTKDKLSVYSFRGTSNSLFIWLNTPEGWTGKEFELTAREIGVNVFCADKFAVGGAAAPSAIRISLTGAETIEELNEGLNGLDKLLSDEYVTLGPVL